MAPTTKTRNKQSKKANKTTGYLTCHTQLESNDQKAKNMKKNVPGTTLRQKLVNVTFRKQPSSGHQTNSLRPSCFEYSSAVDVGIPGFDRLFNTRYGKVGKCLWIIAISAAFVACIHQISLRVKTYFDYTISVDVVMESVTTIHFPAATVCPYQPLIYNKGINDLRRRYAKETNITYQQLNHDYTESWKDKPAIHEFDLLKLENVSVITLWETASINKGHIENNTYVLCEHYTKKNCHLELNYEETPSYMGNCLTIRLNDSIQYDGSHNGYEIHLKGYANELEYWHFTLQLHNSKFSPTHDMLYKDVGQLFHPNFETTVTFYVKEYERANTPHRPCTEDTGSKRCIYTCVEEHIAANVSCRLPYLNFLELPLCTLPEEAKRTHKVTFDVYGAMDDLCHHCNRACRETRYSMVQDVVKPIPNYTRFKVQMAENSIEYITEFIPYSLAALVSDIGGSLGFFLGVCTLTALQLVEFIFSSLLKANRKM